MTLSARARAKAPNRLAARWAPLLARAPDGLLHARLVQTHVAARQVGVQHGLGTRAREIELYLLQADWARGGMGVPAGCRSGLWRGALFNRELPRSLPLSNGSRGGAGRGAGRARTTTSARLCRAHTERCAVAAVQLTFQSANLANHRIPLQRCTVGALHP